MGSPKTYKGNMSFEPLKMNSEVEASEEAAAWVPPNLLSELDATDRRDLIETFLSDTSRRLQRLRSLLADGYDGLARAEAHAIKGAAGQMGLARLASLCRDTELYTANTATRICQEKMTQLEFEFAAVQEEMLRYCR